MNIKVLYVIMTLLSAYIFTGCNKIAAPEIVRLASDSDKLWVTDRTGKKIWTVSRVNANVSGKQTFASAVNDLMLDSKGRLWAVCDGVNGTLYELDPSNLNILSQTILGYGPSAIAFNEKTGTLWITQRFNNQLWEVNPVSKEIISRIDTGREPVDVISVCNGDYMLVVNNLPAMASTAFPVATHLDVIDASTKTVVDRILLKNGSTDARAIAVSSDGKFAYVTHLLARFQLPTNQVDRGWMYTNAMSVIDLDSLSLKTAVLLDTPQRGAANPSSIEISPDGKQIVIALTGSHELCVIDRLAMHDRMAAIKRGEKVIPSIVIWDDIPNDAGFLYGIRDFIPTGGKGPKGFAFGPDGKLTVANYFTGEISIIDGRGKITASNTLGSPVTSTKRGLGDMYFHDATLCFQQWQSCASCHPNDARVDGLNWDLLNDGAGNPKNTKSLLYSHRTPPSMITGIRKDAETAVRAGFKFIFFADLPDDISIAVDEYLKSLAPLPSPYLVDGKLSEAAQRGKPLFDRYCASCHSGPYYTDMKQYHVDWATGRDNVPMDVTALNEIWRTAPYLYDGRSYTMLEMLEIHGPEGNISREEMNDLAEYVLSL